MKLYYCASRKVPKVYMHVLHRSKVGLLPDTRWGRPGNGVQTPGHSHDSSLVASQCWISLRAPGRPLSAGLRAPLSAACDGFVASLTYTDPRFGILNDRALV